MENNEDEFESLLGRIFNGKGEKDIENKDSYVGKMQERFNEVMYKELIEKIAEQVRKEAMKSPKPKTYYEEYKKANRNAINKIHKALGRECWRFELDGIVKAKFNIDRINMINKEQYEGAVKFLDDIVELYRKEY